MMTQRQYLNMVMGVIIGVLFIWVGVTGRLGSLLGAIITPGNMVDGQYQPTSWAGSWPGTNTTETTDPNAVPVSGNSVLTPNQIGAFAYNAGVTSQNNLAIAIAIAMAESGGKVNAENPPNSLSGALGLWQILISAHPGYDASQLVSSASYNAIAMFAVSNGGVNWYPWQTYTNGAYQQFMNQANAAAAQVIAANGGI